MTSAASTNPLDLASRYRDFLADPASASVEWRKLFDRLDADARAWLEGLAISPPRGDGATDFGDARSGARDSINALKLIRAYRVRGHLEADLDPLGLASRGPHRDLDPATYGFSDTDLDRPIFLAGNLGLESASLRELVEALRRDYCGTLGLEFMHIQSFEERTWIEEHMERATRRGVFHKEVKLGILDRLTAAEIFEKYLDKKYKATKRFGLDGCESVVAALEMIVREGVRHGVEDVVIGMSHRGRLNVLANLMEKPLPAIFAEFEGGSSFPQDFQGAGDVKYHLGTSTQREIDGRIIHLSLTPNPSHLEAVNPVVAGRVRARQDGLGDAEHARSMGLLLHGDAAFAGLGIVAETLQFSELSGYRVGGIIHVIVNNQIGFTTSPVKSRSSPYCSDAAKMIQAPIFHVNGDDPEAVVRAASFAVLFRQQFKKDVVLDIYGYRRFGHNEADEPAFTQPKMYEKIVVHPTTLAIYTAQLIREGVVSADEASQRCEAWEARFAEAFEQADSYRVDQAEWLEGAWKGLEPTRGYDARRASTGVALETLREVGAGLTHVPDDLAINRKIERQLRKKREMFESGVGIDWATAEALAFGTLAIEGTPVRLSGEDSGRGTFSHRHAAWIDQQTETTYVPLSHIRDDQARIEIVDSPISEFGVLGFEYGYSVTAPNTLVIWEAQFGDFANGAQVVIDQFLAAGEEKWMRMSGLVLLLPHGFEGQGPEHSSARLERFLQLCAEDNLQVVNCTTPASYFHVLRRQIHRSFRKPLIVMSPKSLLRHREATSRLDELGPDAEFHRVLPCSTLPCKPSQAAQLVLCSGKVYYELIEERAKRDVERVHFLRLEQLYPVPEDALVEALQAYRHCDLVWCQEEPRNMGAWDFLKDLLPEIAHQAGCEKPLIRYAGRETSAAPATGLAKDHRAEQARLLDQALSLGIEPQGRLKYRKSRAESPTPG
jgi:2-oxoglutarate dehydrogenase E1 component